MNNSFTVARRIPSVFFNVDTIDRTYKDMVREVVSEIVKGPPEKLKDFMYRFEISEETEEYTDNHIIRMTISVHHVEQVVHKIELILPQKKTFFERLRIGLKYIFGGKT